MQRDRHIVMSMKNNTEKWEHPFTYRPNGNILSHEDGTHAPYHLKEKGGSGYVFLVYSRGHFSGLLHWHTVLKCKWHCTHFHVPSDNLQSFVVMLTNTFYLSLVCEQLQSGLASQLRASGERFWATDVISYLFVYLLTVGSRLSFCLNLRPTTLAGQMAPELMGP